MRNKAIIILPGVMGSNLYDGASGELLWPKFNFAMSVEEMSKCQDMVDFAHLDSPNGAYHWVDRMLLDSEGKPNYANVTTKRIGDDDFDNEPPRYGSNDEHKKLYLALYERFHKDYDVILYEYDWRLDNNYTAFMLEQYINSRGYESVILVGHSMGGIVADKYLSRSVANRDKVKKLITLGTPHLGAVSILAGLEDPLRITGFSGDKLRTLHEAIDAINGEGACDNMLNRASEVVERLESVYGLLPLLSMYERENGELYVTSLDEGSENIGKSMSIEEISAFVQSRRWAVEKHAKKIISGLNDYFVGGKHVSELLDTTYIAGNGIATTHSLIYDVNCAVQPVMSYAGDRVVTLYSATLGKDIADERVFAIDNCTHADLLAGDTSVNKVVDIIDNITK